VILSRDVPEISQPLTLQEAIERALANYPTIQIQQTFAAQAKGQKTTAGVLPNPTVSYYREDLSLAGENFGEWIIAAGLPLNFLWERWSKTASAVAQVEAQELLVDNARRILKFEVQQAYIRYLFSNKMSKTWQEVNAIFESAVNAGEARFADGDISNYELQRIKMEHLRYQKSYADAESERLARKRHLSFLIHPAQAQPDFDEVRELNIGIPEISPENLIRAAGQNRPDVQAAGRLKRMPDLSLSYGYKEQTDDFAGSIIQLNVGIPLFNRNQGKIRETKAQLNRQLLELTLLEKQAESEIRLAIEQFRIYSEQYLQFAQTDEATLQQTLSAALASYQEGEMSLVELLDAVKAYVETFQLRYDFLTRYYMGLFELEKAGAISVTEF
jgi:cobalt-zinc-cadmium efflux system outer membrane protein